MTERGCSDEIGKSPARGRSNQALLGFPLVGGFKLGQELRLAAGEGRDWQSVPVNHPIRGERREPLSGRQDADQIKGIGARQRLSRSSPTPSGSANCSPEKPATNRPPRISPRASSRRYTRKRSRHGGSHSASRASRRQNTTP